MHRFASFLRLGMVAALLAGIFAQPQTVHAASLPAKINKQFTPLQIDAGGVSVLRISIFNPNTFPLSNVAFIDDLARVQPGLYVANPAGGGEYLRGDGNRRSRRDDRIVERRRGARVGGSHAGAVLH